MTPGACSNSLFVHGHSALLAALFSLISGHGTSTVCPSRSPSFPPCALRYRLVPAPDGRSVAAPAPRPPSASLKSKPICPAPAQSNSAPSEILTLRSQHGYHLHHERSFDHGLLFVGFRIELLYVGSTFCSTSLSRDLSAIRMRSWGHLWGQMGNARSIVRIEPGSIRGKLQRQQRPAVGYAKYSATAWI